MPNFKPFATYDAEGDSFTLHFYMAKQIGGGVVPCLRCGQTMSGLVGPLGICTGGPTDETCNETIFPYLEINKGAMYHDWTVSPARLAETFQIAAKYLDPNMEPPPASYDGWNHDGLSQLRRLLIAAMSEREAVREAMQVGVEVCAQCGFKEPCSCAAFSQQEVTKCQDTTLVAVATADLPAGGTRTTGPTAASAILPIGGTGRPKPNATRSSTKGRML